MRTIIENTNNFTKRDSMNSRNGLPLQDLDDKSTIKVTTAAILEDVDEETGERKEIGVIRTPDKLYYTTISATVIDTMHDLIDIINEEGDVEIRLGKRKSKGGREFLTITIL